MYVFLQKLMWINKTFINHLLLKKNLAKQFVCFFTNFICCSVILQQLHSIWIIKHHYPFTIGHSFLIFQSFNQLLTNIYLSAIDVKDAMIGDLFRHESHGVHVARSAEVLHLGPLLLVTIEHQNLGGVALALFILRTFSTCKYVININIC